MFRSLSDPFLLAAFWAGLTAIGLALALGLLIVSLRLRLRARERRWQRFLAIWRPPLLQVVLDTSARVELPRLAPRDHALFLRLWTYLHASVRGDAARHLNEAALELGVDASARRLLRRGLRAERLQAVLAAGYLRDAAAWDDLVALTTGRDSLLAVHAARALVRIQPLRAANGLLPLMVARDDWDLSRVAAFLTEARQPFWLLLAKALPRMPAEQLPRALQLAEVLRMQLPDATLVRLLQGSHPPEVIRAALRLCDSLALAKEVRRCLAHGAPRVREQAVLQLARLGTPDDVGSMTALLDDADWKVRMAAAQALSRLPFLSHGALAALQASHPAAAAMIRHVLAERGLG